MYSAAVGVCKPKLTGEAKNEKQVIDLGAESHTWGFDNEGFVKEVHFFDTSNYGKGPSFYARHFQHCGEHEFIMDATPNSLMHPKEVYKLYKKVGYDMSQLKLMVVLREPISREYSCYTHKASIYDGGVASRGNWYSDVADVHGNIRTFEQYTNSVLKHVLTPPVFIGASTSLYVDHLRNWIKYFNREQLLVLSFNELKEDPTRFEWRIQQFLGKKEFPSMELEHANIRGNNDHEVPLTAWQTLEEIFGPKNEELYQFLDENPGPWMEQRPFPRFKAA